MMRIETGYQPIRYRRRADGTLAHALKVQDVTLQSVAAWCGGMTWGRGVVVPITVDGKTGETSAVLGDWVYTFDGRTFQVATDHEFRDQFGPVTR